jgi:hypothetical protein
MKNLGRLLSFKCSITYSKNYKLIIVLFSNMFLFIISTNTDSHHINFSHITSKFRTSLSYSYLLIFKSILYGTYRYVYDLSPYKMFAHLPPALRQLSPSTRKLNRDFARPPCCCFTIHNIIPQKKFNISSMFCCHIKFKDLELVSPHR